VYKCIISTHPVSGLKMSVFCFDSLRLRCLNYNQFRNCWRRTKN